MADQKLNLIINGKNNAGPAVDGLKKGLLGLNAATLGLTFSIAGIVAGITKTIKAANQQEIAEAKLAQALKTAGDYSDSSFKSFLNLASAQQKVTKFGDEATIAAIAQLKAYSGLSNEMVGKMIPAVQDFASAQGIDLKTAFELAGKSVGSSLNAFSRYGIEIDTTASKTEKANQIIEGLTKRFGGAAQAEVNTFSGALTQLNNSFGDLLEQLGFWITKSETMSKIINKIKEAVDRITESLSKQTDRQKRLAEVTAQLTREQELYERQEKKWYPTAKIKEKVLNEIRIRIASLRAEQLTLTKAIADDKKVTDENNKSKEKTIGLTEEQIQTEIERLEKEIEASQERLKIAEENEKWNEDQLISSIEHGKATAEAVEAIREDQANKEKARLLELSEATRAYAEFSAAVVASSLDAIGSAFGVFFTVMFTRNKDFSEQMKEVWRGLTSTIIRMIGQLIARMLALQLLTSLFPGGAIVGTGFKALFGKSLAGMFGLQGFQTPYEGTRILPGPPNMPVPFMGHGGEEVGRKKDNNSGTTIVIQGDFFESEEANARLYSRIYKYQKRIGR